MVVETRQLSKRFGRVRALKDVSFASREGEVIALVGLNGAGKTTLLRCIAGLAAPDKGSVSFDGVAFTRDQLEVRRRVMFLGDFPVFFPDRTVLRNIGIILNLYQAATAGIEDRVQSLLREFDLLQYAMQCVHLLSRGQGYKAALAALLAVDPQLWLLDEPFASGMDPLGLAVLRKHLRMAAARGRTVIVSTQIIEVVEKVADRVAILEDGALRAFDTLDALSHGSGDLLDVLSRFRDEAG